MWYCPKCGSDVGGYGSGCPKCKVHFTITQRPNITVLEIAQAIGGIIPSIKAVREDLGCGLLRAKRIVDFIRMTDDEMMEYENERNFRERKV